MFAVVSRKSIAVITIALLLKPSFSFAEESIPANALPDGSTPVEQPAPERSDGAKEFASTNNDFNSLMNSLDKSNVPSQVLMSSDGSVKVITKNNDGTIQFSVNGEVIWSGCGYTTCISPTKTEPTENTPPPKSNLELIAELEKQLQDLNQTNQIDAANPNTNSDILKARTMLIASINRQLIALQKAENKSSVSNELEDLAPKSSNIDSQIADLENQLKELNRTNEIDSKNGNTNSDVLKARAMLIASINKQLAALQKKNRMSSNSDDLIDVSPQITTNSITDLEQQIREIDNQLENNLNSISSSEILKSYISLKASLVKQLESAKKQLVISEKNASKIDSNSVRIEGELSPKVIKQTVINSEKKYAFKIQLPIVSKTITAIATKPGKSKIIFKLKTDENGNLLISSSKNLKGYKLSINLPGKKKFALKII